MILTLSFFVEAGMASLYLVVKLFAVFWMAKVLHTKCVFDRFSSVIAGWLIILAMQAGLILGLSSIGLLRQHYFLVAVAVPAFFLYWRAKTLRFGPVSFPRSWQNRLPLAVIALVFFAMWLRALFFYDFTWDAQTYGLPRLAIWLHSGSVLTHMPTLQLNLFVNEWNAELNALAYGLVSNSYSGFGFGNLEVLLMLFVTLIWVALQLGAPLFWALSLSAILGSTPATLGLASTIKGDLLACVAFLIACGWLIKIRHDDKSIPAILMLMLSAVLAVGSKISVLLPSLVILAFAVHLMGLSGLHNLLRLPRIISVAALAAVLSFSSRFWLNWFVYGDPMRRVDVEKVQFSFENMLGNLRIAFNRIFGIAGELMREGQMWALAGSMGGTAWLISGVFTLYVMRLFVNNHKSTPPLEVSGDKISLNNGRAKANIESSYDTVFNNKWMCSVIAIIVAAILASMTLSAPFPWTFRYFYPGIAMLFLFVGVRSAGKINSGGGRVFLLGASLLAIGVNVVILSRHGEVLPTSNFPALVAEIKRANTPLKRISLFVKGPYQMAGTEALGLDSDKPLHILALKDLDTSLAPFIGSHAQNKIELVADGKAFIAAAIQPKWDAVVILQELTRRDPSLKVALEAQNYWVAIDNAQYVIGLPKSRIKLTPLSLDNINWGPWNASADVQLSVDDGMPKVSSERPADAGFLSQDFVFKEAVLIKASFEGQIFGNGLHAAHLSLHGKQPIITLPSGKYSSQELFQGFIPASEKPNLPQRLCFGLGGWTMGSGRLTMTNFEAYSVSILDPINTVKSQGENNQNISVVKVAFITVAALMGCVILGRRILDACGFFNLSVMGINFVVGYGVFGLVLLLSLRYLGSSLIGLALLFGILGAFIVNSIKKRWLESSEKKTENLNEKKIKVGKLDLADALIALTLLSWAVAVALIYAPLVLMAENPSYQFPEIFDLPKHLFAQLSLYDAKGWPAPNPFFSTESFSYNYLFYLLPASIAKLANSSLANFCTLGVVVVAIAVALPMAMFDVLRSITKSKFAQLIGVLLATWVGGLTPLWIDKQPAIGFLLYSEKLIASKIWVDELFQSVIFVPQHVYATLCAVVAVYLIMRESFQGKVHRKFFVAAMISTAGALSSFILLPHIAISFGICFLLTVFFGLRAFRDEVLKLILSYKFAFAVLIPCFVIAPFLFEILQWSAETGELANAPEFSSQWFYVIAALGMVVPLSIVGALHFFGEQKEEPLFSLENRIIIGIVILALVGVFGLLFGGYPDAGIKSGLWVRIMLIPIACIGVDCLMCGSNKFKKAGVGLVIAGIFIFIAILNYPTAKYFVRSAWRPIDPGIKTFILYVRSLPLSAKIALFSPEQVLVAMSGRQMDFDFSTLREDSYMPPDGRIRANQFWRGIDDEDPKVWSELPLKYEYLIAPIGSSADLSFADKLTKNVSLGGYTVYKTNASHSP